MGIHIKYGLSLATLMLVIALPSRTIWAQDCSNPALSFSGRGTAADVHALLINATISDTGPLPSSGGSLQASLASINLGSLLSSQTADASTTGQCDTVDSQASVESLRADLLAVTVTADLITSQAQASCSGSNASASGSSQLTNLKINGVPVEINGQPNQIVTSGLLTITINEQIPGQASASQAAMIVNALHLSAAGVGSVIVSSSQAYISCPTGGGGGSTT